MLKAEGAIEALGLLIAENKDRMLQAMKGKPEVLLEMASDYDSVDNVTAIAG